MKSPVPACTHATSLIAGVVAALSFACSEPTISSSVASIQIVTSASVYPAGTTLTLRADLRDAQGNVVLESVQWSSSNSSVASVSTAGFLIAIAPGQVVVTAKSGSVTATTTLRIVPVHVIKSVAIAPAGSSSLQTNEKRTFTATVVLEPNSPPASVAWTTSNPNVATVDSAGTVTGLAAGNVSLIARATTSAVDGYLADIAQASVTVIVTPPRPAITQFTLSPSTATLGVLLDLQLVPTVTPANPSVVPTFGYVSSAPAVAIVSNDGLVRTLAPGVATITATAMAPAGIGLAATSLLRASTIVVTAVNGITALSATPGTVMLVRGGSQTLTVSLQQPTGAPVATISFDNGSPNVVTVSPNGVITGINVGAGTVTVRASSIAGNGFVASTRTWVIPVVVSPN